MKRIDGRKLSHEVSEYIRLTAVKRVEEDNESVDEVMASYGLSRTSYYRWRAALKQRGMKALASTRGTGRPGKLSERQGETVRRWICGTNPRQYGLDFGLWTRNVVRELVATKWQIQLSVVSVGRLLKRLGLTPQKPLRRAYEQNPAAVKQWKAEQYPTLRKRAKERGAKILFLDEAGVRSDAAVGRTWSAKGETPSVEVHGTRQQVNAISAVSETGEFWFQVSTESLTAELFIDHLRALMKYQNEPLFVVVDGHPAHRAKKVARFVQEQQGRLELHFLPGYAPELNPDEFVWNHLKTHELGKKPLRKGESLFERVFTALASILLRPELVRSFFEAQTVAYIMN